MHYGFRNGFGNMAEQLTFDLCLVEGIFLLFCDSTEVDFAVECLPIFFYCV